MNTCDISELRHQLLQEFYKLAEKPEEWETNIDLFVGPTYTSGPLRLTPGRWSPYSSDKYKLCVDDRNIHCESAKKAKHSSELVTKRVGWFRTQSKYVEKVDYVPNDSQFVTTCQSLIKGINQIAECKALEEALANVNKPKAKAPRKAKAPKEKGRGEESQGATNT